MNRIRTALKDYAERYLEAMAFADPAGLAYYALEPIAAGPDARRPGDGVSAEAATVRQYEPTAIAA